VYQSSRSLAGGTAEAEDEAGVASAGTRGSHERHGMSTVVV
jgi:hypothetical protein